MDKQKKLRFVLLLTVIGSIMSNQRTKTTKLHQLILLKIDTEIRKAHRTNLLHDKDILATDKIFHKAIEAFRGKNLERTFALSILYSMESRNFDKAGIGKGRVAKYYNTLTTQDAVITESNTREMMIHFYNEVSSMLGLDGYKQKSWRQK